MIHLITQDVITRGHDARAAATALGWRHSELAGITCLDEAPLAALEGEIAKSGDMPLVFCSLQIAGRIRRRHPGLVRGLFLPEAFLRWHRYTSVLPRGVLLNPDAVLLPWSRIPDTAPRLRPLLGDGIFIRPDSPMKPFTGFSVGTDALAFEHAALGRAAAIDPAELCVLAPARTIDPVEYRFWLVNGAVSRAAPGGAAYGWHEGSEDAGRAPKEVVELAECLARDLEQHDNLLVADLAIVDGDARLVELNAVATSGWYKGMNPERLLRDIAEIISP